MKLISQLVQHEEEANLGVAGPLSCDFIVSQQNVTWRKRQTEEESALLLVQ